MKMLSVIAALPAMTLALTVSAGAQTGSANAGAAFTVNHGMPAGKLIGAHIYNGQGRSIGSVDVMTTNHAVEPTAILSMSDMVSVTDATKQMLPNISPDELNWMAGGGG